MRNSLITFALVLSLPMAAHATTYDAVTGFSTSNPSGPWAYGQYTESTSTFTSFSSTASTGYGGYTYFGNLPLVGYNTDNTAAYAAGSNNTFYVPQTELWLHPGPGAGQDADVEFTVPTSGYYSVNGEFSSRNDAVGEGNGVIVSVLIDGQLDGDSSLTGQVGSTALIYTGADTVYLPAGTVFDFLVNNNGDYSYDSTGFDVAFTSSATPEPSSLVLLGTGILGLAGAARRKMRS